jgi:hypothetical protein
MANTIDLTGDLPLVVPVKGATNWDEDMKNKTFQKIADHDHTAGKGSQIDTAALKDNAVTNAKMADNAVDTVEIVDSAVKTAKIADSNDSDQGVTAAKLQSNSVTGVKINADAVDQSKIADDAIQFEHKKYYSIAGPTDTTYKTILTFNTLNSAITSASNQFTFKILYRIKNSAGTEMQFGELSGGNYDTNSRICQDEFYGIDLDYTWQLALDGSNIILRTRTETTRTDTITYSIELLEV